ncbi:MAG TPA: thioredoxin domain-containing protein [Patescibacteria group bacterium]|nr:thioredoxin domain-containing protein [Patescibacteria group bacterium]
MKLRFALLAALLALAAPALAAEKIDTGKALADRVLGKEDAPITVYEYASLTCPHCAAFNRVALPEIKKHLIDTGKAKMVFRDFPLDGYAFKAAAMARCAPDDKFYPLVDMIFAEQERWARSSAPDDAVAKLGVLAGMEEEQIKSCMNDEGLKQAILEKMQAAQKTYSISSTPTFIFMKGEERMMEYPEWDAILKEAEKQQDAHKH